MVLEWGCWQISSSHSYCKDAFLKKIIIKEFTVSTLDQPCFLSLLSCIPSNWQQNGQVETSAQRVGFFNIGSGRVGYWKKYRVAGRVRVG